MNKICSPQENTTKDEEAEKYFIFYTPEGVPYTVVKGVRIYLTVYKKPEAVIKQSPRIQRYVLEDLFNVKMRNGKYL